MTEKLDGDTALDAAARANTRENVRLTFDQKVERVIQEIVDSNFDLYKRITDRLPAIVTGIFWIWCKLDGVEPTLCGLWPIRRPRPKKNSWAIILRAPISTSIRGRQAD